MSRTWRVMLVAAFALVFAAVLAAQDPTEDSTSFPDIVDHFKYGSIGTEERVGLPYWIWRVLPTVFEDKLPKRPGTGTNGWDSCRTASGMRGRSGRRTSRAGLRASG